MKFERTDSFKADFKRLTAGEREKAKSAIPEFNAAAEAFILHQQPWPTRFRVKPIQGADGIWEMTWSFSGPDGRATWEWFSIVERKGRKTIQEPAIRWRRIGGHDIFRNP